MIRRSPTRIELKLEDMQDFEYNSKTERRKGTIPTGSEDVKKLIRQERIGYQALSATRHPPMLPTTGRRGHPPGIPANQARMRPSTSAQTIPAPSSTRNTESEEEPNEDLMEMSIPQPPNPDVAGMLTEPTDNPHPNLRLDQLESSPDEHS